MGDYVDIDVQDRREHSTAYLAIDRMMHDTESTGVSLVELWVLRDSRLMRMCSTMEEPTNDGYNLFSDVGPGEGLPGILWMETANRRRYPKRKTGSHTLIWRDIRNLTNDPHRLSTERMLNLSQSFRYVVGVPFDSGDNSAKGIVLYYRTENEISGKGSSDRYLIAAAAAIGQMYVAEQSRLQLLNQQTPHHQMSLKDDAETAIGSDEESEGYNSLESPIKSEVLGEPEQLHQFSSMPHASFVCTKVHSTLSKSLHGGGLSPPPSMPWQQSIFSLMGALVTLSIVTKLSHHLVTTYDSDFEIVLGPFGALVTLLFALSAAPAAQPRNALIGQIVSLTIATSIGQYTTFDTWMKQALATALSVASMAKLGVTHPPAGAAAMIFSAGNHNWIHVGMMLIGNAIALGMATLFNNLSEKRQYPTYWELFPDYRSLMELLALDSDEPKKSRRSSS